MSERYEWLFQERAIGSRVAANLLALHPLERMDGTPEGKPRETAYDWYRRLAAGHWGILFVECTTCSDDPADRGHSPDGFLMTEANLPEFRRLVSEIKDVSPETVVMIQLSTGAPGNGHANNDAFMNLSASAIERSKQYMIDNSVLAAEAGFDGMDFKLCHGHLTYHILREDNARQDEWGGKTLKERARFVIEVVEGIQAELTRRDMGDFIMGARVSEPSLANLMDIVDVLDGDLGMDFISVSNTPDVFDRAIISLLTQAVKMRSTNAAVMQAAFSSYLARLGNAVEHMRLALESRLAPDFVGFGRQAIADPLTPVKLRNGEYDGIDWCRRCNTCFSQRFCKHHGPKPQE